MNLRRWRESAGELQSDQFAPLAQDQRQVRQVAKNAKKRVGVGVFSKIVEAILEERLMPVRWPTILVFPWRAWRLGGLGAFFNSRWPREGTEERCRAAA